MKTKDTSSHIYQDDDNVLAQFFVIYDWENKPCVLMNFQGFDDQTSAEKFIENFKQDKRYTDIDLHGQTIH